MTTRRLRGKIILVATVAGLALAAGLGHLIAPHLTTPSVAAPAGPNTTAPAPQSGGTPPAYSSPLPNLIANIGEKKYPNTFSGTYITDDGRLVVCTTTNDTTFKQAVAKLNTEHLPVRFVRAKLSYHQLNTAADAMTNHMQQLLHDGVNLDAWYPTAPYDAIYVTLDQPTNRDLQRLSTSGLVPQNLTPVTQSNYKAAASAAIASDLSPNYKVKPAYGEPIKAG